MKINLVLQRIYQCVTDLKTTMDQHYQSSQPHQQKKTDIKPNQNQISYKTIKKQVKMTEKNSAVDQDQSEKKLISKQIKKITKKYEPPMTEQEKQEIRKRLLQQRPKPPMNAFISYVKAQKDRIKNNSSVNLSIAQITAEASVEWKKLPEEQKEPYVKQYQKSHIQYMVKRDKFIKQNPILKKIKMKKMKQKESKTYLVFDQKLKNVKQQLDDEHLKIIKSNEDQQSSVSDSEPSVSSSSVSSSSVSDSEQDQNGVRIEREIKQQTSINTSKPKINISISSSKALSGHSLSLANKDNQRETQREKSLKQFHLDLNKRERPKYERVNEEVDLNNAKQGYKRKFQSESIRSQLPKMMQNKTQNQQQKYMQIEKHRREDLDRQKQFERQKLMMQESKQRSKGKQEQKIKSEAKQKMLNMLSKKIDTPKVQSNISVKDQQIESDSLNN